MPISLVPKASKTVLFSKFSSVYTMPFPKSVGWSSIFKLYRFQNLPAKNVPFSCERETYPSHFSPFSKCAGIVWTLSQCLKTRQPDAQGKSKCRRGSSHLRLFNANNSDKMGMFLLIYHSLRKTTILSILDIANVELDLLIHEAF